MKNLLFSSCTPPDWSIEAPKHIFHGNSGAPETIISSVQNPELRDDDADSGMGSPARPRELDEPDLRPVKAITDKKANVTVVFMDSTGQALFQWVGTGALLTGFSHVRRTPPRTRVLTVTATIDADSWQLQGSSGGSPLVRT